MGEEEGSYGYVTDWKMENRACIVQYICNRSEKREGGFEYLSDKFYCVWNQMLMVNAGYEGLQKRPAIQRE